MRGSKYGILIGSDSAQLRDSLTVAFAGSGLFEIAGTVDLEQLVSSAETLQPEVVVFELSGDWKQLLKGLKTCCPLTLIVAMAGNPNRYSMADLVRSGATGCLPLRLLPQQIVTAVELMVEAGLLCLPRPSLSPNRAGDNGDNRIINSSLSYREKEILEMLGKKMSIQEIAASLYISETTVKTHLRNIYRKLSVRNRAEAVAVAYQMGLVGETT